MTKKQQERLIVVSTLAIVGLLLSLVWSRYSENDDTRINAKLERTKQEQTKAFEEYNKASANYNEAEKTPGTSNEKRRLLKERDDAYEKREASTMAVVYASKEAITGEDDSPGIWAWFIKVIMKHPSLLWIGGIAIMIIGAIAKNANEKHEKQNKPPV